MSTGSLATHLLRLQHHHDVVALHEGGGLGACWPEVQEASKGGAWLQGRVQGCLWCAEQTQHIPS